MGRSARSDTRSTRNVLVHAAGEQEDFRPLFLPGPPALVLWSGAVPRGLSQSNVRQNATVCIRGEPLSAGSPAGRGFQRRGPKFQPGPGAQPGHPTIFPPPAGGNAPGRRPAATRGARRAGFTTRPAPGDWNDAILRSGHYVTAQAVEAACWMSGGHLDMPEHFAAGLKPHSVSEKYYFARGPQLVNRVVDIGPTLETKLSCLRSCRTMMTHMIKDLNASVAERNLRSAASSVDCTIGSLALVNFCHGKNDHRAGGSPVHYASRTRTGGRGVTSFRGSPDPGDLPGTARPRRAAARNHTGYNPEEQHSGRRGAHRGRLSLRMHISSREIARREGRG